MTQDKIRRGAIVWFCAVFIVCMLFSGQTAYASGEDQTDAAQNSAVKEAECVIPDIGCDELPYERFNAMKDDNYFSSFRTKNKIQLRFSTSTPVQGIYLMLDRPCQWSLTLPDGTVKNCGNDGYFHEYVGFDQPVTEFIADFPAKAKIADVYAFTEGQLPDWVQIWEPTCESADLLFLPTHSDDEYLWFGGALPYYAGELGYRVQVVYLTNHFDLPYRCHELLNGLWKVGVKNYPVMNERFPDVAESKASLKEAKRIYGYNNALAFQVEILRRFKPKVVLGHAVNGEYGHGAHKLNAATLLDALKIYDDPSVFPESAEKYGSDKIGKCYLHLERENGITVTWSDKKLSRFGGKSSLEMAKEGFACHKSQQKCPFKVSESGESDCRLFGLVYTTVGYDTPGVNDMFEHVEMAAPDEVIPAETVSDADVSDVPKESDEKDNASLAGIDRKIIVAALAALVCAAAVSLLFIKKTGSRKV